MFPIKIFTSGLSLWGDKCSASSHVIQMGKHNFNNKVPITFNVFGQLAYDFDIVYIEYYIRTQCTSLLRKIQIKSNRLNWWHCIDPDPNSIF